MAKKTKHEMPPNSPKLQHYSLFQQNSVNVCKDFTREYHYSRVMSGNLGAVVTLTNVCFAQNIRAPERWERWEPVPSQFEILAAAFGQPAERASEISVHQPKLTSGNGDCHSNWSKAKKSCIKTTVIGKISLKTTNICFF